MAPFLGSLFRFAQKEAGDPSAAEIDLRGEAVAIILSSLPSHFLPSFVFFAFWSFGEDSTTGEGGGGTESMGLRRERVERVRAPLPPPCNATSIPETEAGPRLASVFINVVPV